VHEDGTFREVDDSQAISVIQIAICICRSKMPHLELLLALPAMKEF